MMKMNFYGRGLGDKCGYVIGVVIGDTVGVGM